jgi:hypothetical protein
MPLLATELYQTIETSLTYSVPRRKKNARCIAEFCDSVSTYTGYPIAASNSAAMAKYFS